MIVGIVSMAATDRHRRLRLVVAISAAAALLGAAGHATTRDVALGTLDGDLLIPLLSVIFAVAGMTRVITHKG
jgi:hypothetical protein